MTTTHNPSDARSDVTEEQMHVLRHALGLGNHGEGVMYRNHFVTGEGSKDYPTCMALVDSGLMVKRSGGPLTGGDDLFLVTDIGKTLAVGEAPKLTRSQRNYRDFLAADSGLTFGAWLKRRAALAKEPA